MADRADSASALEAKPPLFLLWAGTILIGFILALVTAEGIARLSHVRTLKVEQGAYIGWAKRDPVLGWRNNPGIHRSHEGSHEPMTFLEDGSRFTGAPRGTDTSVLIVGCSFSSGYGVRDREAFAARLQQRFPNEPVRNFAVSGYGTYQSLLMLRELLGKRGYHPKVVIYGMLEMHAGRNVLTVGNLEAFRAFGGERFPPPHIEIHDEKFVEYPPYVVPSWPLEERSAAVALLHSTLLKIRFSGRERDEVPVMGMLLREMKRIAEAAGARFLVPILWDDREPWHQKVQPYIESMRRDDIEFIDVTYDGPDKRWDKLTVGGTGHPGPVIHSWWAAKIGDWLERERIVKP